MSKDEDTSSGKDSVYVNAIRGPTLLLIWKQFIEDGKTQSDTVTAEELCTRWSRAIEMERFEGRYLSVERCTMNRCLSHISPFICREDGTSGMERWLHALLCCCSGGQSRAAVRTLQGLLEANLKSSRQAPHKLREQLEKFCPGRSGRQKIQELMEECLKKSSLDKNSLESTPLASGGHSVRYDVVTMNALKAFGFYGDELITYPQILGLCFGRFEVPVTVNMYDLSGGMAKSWTGVEGIWHTAVVVFGREYFYNGRPVLEKPGESDFGEVAKVLTMGWSLHKQYELHSFVVEHLNKRFTLESYDVMTNNCNHFTDELLRFLLDEPLPDNVLRQEERLMQLPGVRFVWPAFRNILNSCNVNSRQHAGLIYEGSEVATYTAQIQAAGKLAPAKTGRIDPKDRVDRQSAPKTDVSSEVGTASTECTIGAIDPDEDDPDLVDDEPLRQELNYSLSENMFSHAQERVKDINVLLHMARERNAEPLDYGDHVALERTASEIAAHLQPPSNCYLRTAWSDMPYQKVPMTSPRPGSRAASQSPSVTPRLKTYTV